MNQRNQKYYLARARIDRLERKLRVMRHYCGGKWPRCKCCGEDELEFLAIDHADGDGAAHRKRTGLGGGNEFYKWIEEHNFPRGLRVLCHNCNIALGAFGYCPHKLNTSSKQRLVELNHKYPRRGVARGERVSASKLTATKVARIRALWKRGRHTYTALGRLFKVSRVSIRHIVSCKTWAIGKQSH